VDGWSAGLGLGQVLIVFNAMAAVSAMTLTMDFVIQIGNLVFALTASDASFAGGVSHGAEWFLSLVLICSAQHLTDDTRDQPYRPDEAKNCGRNQVVSVSSIANDGNESSQAEEHVDAEVGNHELVLALLIWVLMTWVITRPKMRTRGLPGQVARVLAWRRRF
jgi:hypothetical protein